MKIIILQGAFLPVPPKLGGAVEKMWFALGKDFVRKGHEVIHISRRYPGLKQEENIEGVLHKRISGYATPVSGIYLKWLDLRYTLRAKKFIPVDSDVIVTNTFWAPIVLPANLKRRCMVDVQRMPKGQIKWYKKSSVIRANSTFVSKAIKQELSPANHKQVIMIPNPLPFDNSIQIESGEKKKIILYAGRVHPEKGLEILIEAFKALEGKWLLKIVGPWETNAGGGGVAYFNKLKNAARYSNVDFWGPVFDSDKLNSLYREASIFIYPSVAERGETFGLAPLEAMAWGCVPIVSNLECFQDFIKDGVNGLVFDHRGGNAVVLLKNAIERLQQDAKFRCKLAAEAQRVRDTHSSSTISKLFLREFRRIATD